MKYDLILEEAVDGTLGTMDKRRVGVVCRVGEDA